MQTIRIFCNYGVLSREKRNIYTFGGQHETATCSDEMTVEIPDGWNLFETISGETMVTAPWGWEYDINEVLSGNQVPQFRALDKDGKLNVFNLKEVQDKGNMTE